jgi:hypothetical protein
MMTTSKPAIREHVFNRVPEMIYEGCFSVRCVSCHELACDAPEECHGERQSAGELFGAMMTPEEL